MPRVPLRWLAPVVLLLAGGLAYSNSFDGAFQLDDFHFILAQDRRATFEGYVGTHLTRPFAAATFWLNAQVAKGDSYFYTLLEIFGGLTPGPFHVVNLAIHLLAGLTLFGLVRRSLRRMPRFAAAADGLAFAVALLWVVHPLNTHAVTYIVQRCESMMGLFFLLTFYCLVRAQDSAQPRIWYQLSVLCAVLGSATKEVMATAPPILLVFDRVVLAPDWRTVLRRRFGYHLAAAAACWTLPLFAHLVAVSAEEAAATAVGTGAMTSRWTYLLTQSTVLPHYLALAVWPDALSFEYRDWPGYPSLGMVWQYFVPIAIAIGFTICGVIRGKWYGLLGTWFFGVLSLTSSVLPIIDNVAEYRMYLPLIPVIVLLVVGGYCLLTFLVDEPGRSWVAWLVVVGLAWALGTRTFVRNVDYRTMESLWTKNLETRPLDPQAYFFLGVAAENRGDLPEAAEQYRRGLKKAVGKYLPEASKRLALLDYWRGDDAIRRQLETLHVSEVDYFSAIEQSETDGPTALRRVREWRQIAPHASYLAMLEAALCEEQGRVAEARKPLAEGLAIFPEYADYARAKAQFWSDNPFFRDRLGQRFAAILRRQAEMASRGR
jgi:tetratricopeptide (TPR) repeat protein